MPASCRTTESAPRRRGGISKLVALSPELMATAVLSGGGRTSRGGARRSRPFAMATARFSGHAASGIVGDIEKRLVDTANELAAQLGKAAVTAVVALI